MHHTTKAQGGRELSVCGPSCDAVYSCNESVFRRLRTRPEEDVDILLVGALKNIGERKASGKVTGQRLIVVYIVNTNQK